MSEMMEPVRARVAMKKVQEIFAEADAETRAKFLLALENVSFEANKTRDGAEAVRVMKEMNEKLFKVGELEWEACKVRADGPKAEDGRSDDGDDEDEHKQFMVDVDKVIKQIDDQIDRMNRERRMKEAAERSAGEGLGEDADADVNRSLAEDRHFDTVHFIVMQMGLGADPRRLAMRLGRELKMPWLVARVRLARLPWVIEVPKKKQNPVAKTLRRYGAQFAVDYDRI